MSELQPYSKDAQLGRGERGKKAIEKRSKWKRLGHNSTLVAPTEPMKPFSAKRRAVYEQQYLPKREAFLKEHLYCELRIVGICTNLATEIQHMVQRSLDPSVENLLDEEHWMASCSPCNSWAGHHPAEARLLGVELSPQERETEEQG